MNNNKLEFDFTFSYSQSPGEILKNFKGKIPTGQCIVLCGKSGCGKSTALRCINRLIPEFYEGNLKGHCYIDGKDTEQLSIGETGKLASSVFQDPRSQFFTLNSTMEIAFGLENHGFSHEEIKEKVDRAFRVFQLEDLRNRNVFELSSGERQLIAILSAWATDTEVFLLDEPSANLDEEGTENLGKMISRLKEQGKTIILSEHRLSYLKNMGDQFWLMENGEIKARLTADEIEKMTEEERTETGLRTLNPEALPYRGEEQKECSCHNVLEGKQISFSYGRKKTKAADRISFYSKTGDIIAVTGPNGSGKTTFGKLAAGIYKNSEGKFLFNGKEITSKGLQEQAVFIMQEAEFQFFTNTVMNELLYGLEKNEENTEKAEELLKGAGLYKYRDRHPFSLSGGEMQRLVMLLGCISEKPVIILDEPTAGLDYASLINTVKTIKTMSESKIVFIITHDLELISRVCTSCMEIRDGRAERCFPLSGEKEFQQLKEMMNKRNRKKREAGQKLEKRSLHPEVKILLLLVAMIAGIFTDLSLILMVFLVLTAACIYEKNYSIPFAAGSVMGLIYLAYLLHPSVGISFIAFFFPRMILIGTGAAMVITGNETSRTLAGLRKAGIPEKVIMIASVIFRFFPVLSRDLKIMSQSVKTRGLFHTTWEKIKGAPGYIEILIVPMAFRVMRIAEALSASAETRGISLKGKRSSYFKLEFKTADFLMLVILVAGISAGLMI